MAELLRSFAHTPAPHDRRPAHARLRPRRPAQRRAPPRRRRAQRRQREHEPFAPLRPDGSLDAPDTLDMPTEMVAVATAPIVYAANARVVRAQDTVLGSLLDVLA
jgi:hypothetical protein